ncbi:RCC1 domain-containing protein [Francisella tularensis]|uniref:RCC1 domain-containing protein n=2 Tax=Francisella tularensis TaxID=263 RepID=UPI001C0ED638|nr:regulator [Francisella tularensis]MBK2024067.1 regulator [Francisella tularensis subsp. tularensis]MBK2043263.1 regulator [Francisella tularensis subsp. tularensis]QXF53048.1 regulator [Francisella tularensis]
MKKNILVLILLSLWCNAFASYTFTQTFFGSYDPSLDSNFAYKNDDYRDDAKIEKYNNKFSKDDSDNYNCSFDSSGQIRCGDYKIKNPKYEDKDDVYCWGSNKRGQLGSETEKSKIKKPLRIDIDSSINFKKVYTKAHYACALDESGYAYCWGDGSNGEVGNGEKGHFTTPQKVKTDIQFSRLSMARTYTCGVAKQTNQVYCWGKSKKGQTNLDSAVPVEDISNDSRF